MKEHAIIATNDPKEAEKDMDKLSEDGYEFKFMAYNRSQYTMWIVMEKEVTE